jgi:hypothetical protein
MLNKWICKRCYIAAAANTSDSAASGIKAVL